LKIEIKNYFELYLCIKLSKNFFMKKILLILFIGLVYSINIHAQSKYTVFDNWHVNINNGPTIFLGDVTQHYEWYKPDLSTPKYSFGIQLIKELNCVLSVRGQLGYGWVAGKKDFYENGDPAGLSFNAHFYHFNAQAKINFIDLFAGGKCYRKINFYGFAGLGFINFQNRLYKDGVEVLSWGYGRVGTHRWVTEITVPFGLGADIRLGQKWRINFDVEAIWVDNEKLDRVVGGYEHDAIIYPNLGVSYNISKNNRVCCKKFKNVPDYNANTQPNVSLDKADKVLVKADSLNNLLDKSFVKLDAINNRIDLAQNKLDSLKFKKDTVYIVKEATYYSDSINMLLKRAGYLWYNVYFDLDKYNIKPEYDSVITRVAEIMKKDPGLRIRVVGNADQQGSFMYNEVLSKNRSQEVINVLVKKHGINRNRLVLDYKGEREPISEIHFELNRRVDFVKIRK
jgi:outer membrane protein OmpA-like peptidoglycan-associated protein